MSGLGHVVEVLVPAAPAHLERCRRAGAADATGDVGPPLEQRRGLRGRPGLDVDGVELEA